LCVGTARCISIAKNKTKNKWYEFPVDSTHEEFFGDDMFGFESSSLLTDVEMPAPP
jgi:hypothetical protein